LKGNSEPTDFEKEKPENLLAFVFPVKPGEISSYGQELHKKDFLSCKWSNVSGTWE
jgi:hypothetical protein